MGQVILFSIYKLFGADGIIFLKSFILTTCLLIVYLRAKLLGSISLYSLLVTFLAGMTALHFTGERPQLFSFFFASLLFLSLDNFKRTNCSLWLYSVPLTILFWSNCHGGVILGAILLSIYAISEVIESRLHINDTRNGSMSLLIVIAVSILITLITPAGISKYFCVFLQQGTELQKRTSEYISPLRLLKSSVTALIYYWTLLLVSVPALYKLTRDKEMQKVLTVLFLLVISLTSFRYIPFFIFIAGPYIASAMSKLTGRFRLNGDLSHAFVISVSIFALINGIHNGRVFQKGINEERFPVSSVNLIKQSGIRGKMFNTMNWGGYILWQLYPKIHIFIDGRAVTMDLERIQQYTHILWATKEGIEIFEKEKFDFVLIPYRNALTGEVYPLNWYLLGNPEWTVLYKDERGYLLKRKT